MDFYLKNCPDCGGVVSIKGYSNSKVWVVECKNHNCPICPRLVKDDIKEIIKEWNDR